MSTQTPAPTAGRRLSPLALAGLIIAAVLLVVGAPVALITTGIIGFGAAASVDDAPARDKELQKADPAGGTACNYLDMEMGGIGTWDDVAEHTFYATTMSIRTATTERELYDACTAAGANLQPWPGQLPSFD